KEEKANILVVDDLPEKLLVFSSILEEVGENLVMVRSGSEALREVLTREFAVILLDVNMPDIDGLETGRLIRQYKKSAHTPIIFITAYADEMQTAQGYSLGAVDYILSPVRPDVLRSKVKVFVDLYKMQQRTKAMAEAEVARLAAEEATRRSNFLAHASHELGASLDLEQGMRRLLELVVPHVCDAAAVTVEKEPGSYSTLSLPAADYVPGPLQAALRRSIEEGTPAEGGAAQGISATVSYPLRVADRVIGAFALGYTGRAPRDLVMLEEMVGRAAIALDNARLYRSLKREITRSRQAEEDLQDANRRKDEFLAMLSHELRNPLAPIRNAVELMRRVGSPEPRVTMARDVIDRQVTQLARLVDELLDVSRISQGKIVLKKEPIELAKIIAHSVETARPMIDLREQRLSVEVSGRPVWLLGDFARLAQVVANLLNNASKYTPEGGRIKLFATAGEGQATISVEDDGTGIDAELLPRVFELFVQGERGLDRSQGGLGIGLTLVKRLVELHQGQVEAKSAGAGKGSTFVVTLPSISAVHADTPPAIAAAATSPQVYGRRVLVVDDNVDAAESTAAFLRLEGHEVKTVSDGNEALSSVHVFAPHVVVLDIGLPGLDGYAVARRLREDGHTSHALLIALTGYGAREDREKALASGFDFHFVKPTDPRQIQHAIEQGRQNREGSVSNQHAPHTRH
ncbi:MAG TPA: response regulator, partial [Burkholderiales bacterium]|nr:response regulator [Burkholderiales bacterium]